nr:SDR family oxidoreductase [Pseudobutyrivibrio sp.]
ANYCASKAGIIGFTKSVAREYGSKGVTVNAVAPGFIQTAMTDKLPDDVKDAYLKQIPAGRFGTGEDVANVVEFLASDKAAYVTGQVIEVTGGM